MEEFNQITLGGIKMIRVLDNSDEYNDVFVYVWRTPERESKNFASIGKLIITKVYDSISKKSEWIFNIENEDEYIPMSVIKDLDKLIDRIKEKYK